MIRIELNFLPPPDNAKFVRVRGNRWLISPRYRDFLDDLAALWRKLGSPRVPGWVVVEFHVRFPDKRRRDAGNLIKAAMDGLQKCGAIEEDSLALPRIMTVRRAPEDGEGEGLTIGIRSAFPDEIPSSLRTGSRPPRASVD